MKCRQGRLLCRMWVKAMRGAEVRTRGSKGLHDPNTQYPRLGSTHICVEYSLAKTQVTHSADLHAALPHVRRLRSYLLPAPRPIKLLRVYANIFFQTLDVATLTLLQLPFDCKHMANARPGLTSLRRGSGHA